MAAFKGRRRAAEIGLQIGSGFQKDGSGCLQIGTVRGRKRVIEEEGKRGERRWQGQRPPMVDDVPEEEG
ncbi:hypothetical protein L1887_44447 [Cichorium endivia]|nr:hypothetical protein L1887_44447 [Cichorium endivia]